MQISVTSIKPCDHHFNPDFPKMEAVINFYDDKTEYHDSAEINVFIDKRDYTISELKKEAIQKAYDFLKIALSSQS